MPRPETPQDARRPRRPAGGSRFLGARGAPHHRVEVPSDRHRPQGEKRGRRAGVRPHARPSGRGDLAPAGVAVLPLARPGRGDWMRRGRARRGEDGPVRRVCHHADGRALPQVRAPRPDPGGPVRGPHHGQATVQQDVDQGGHGHVPARRRRPPLQRRPAVPPTGLRRGHPRGRRRDHGAAGYRHPRRGLERLPPPQQGLAQRHLRSRGQARARRRLVRRRRGPQLLGGDVSVSDATNTRRPRSSPTTSSSPHHLTSRTFLSRRPSAARAADGGERLEDARRRQANGAHNP
mmetsp:Transcript_10589/g.32621  ORF Transcript_10589/g.32621 Transcript_10589/m.32621 type:complete len:291 (-) Transcript_10589:100-972(-)